jgi:hypothetical protein
MTRPVANKMAVQRPARFPLEISGDLLLILIWINNVAAGHRHAERT